MASILDGKSILAVDDEPDVLTVLEEEIRQACAGCTFDKATTYEEAARLLGSKQYDIVVLDIMGVRGFELLEIAVKRHFNVAMLTAHALSAEALKKSHDLGARAYLPKDKLGEITPFLEDMLKYEDKPGWEHLLEKLEGYFDSRFEGGWRSGLSDW
jgi:CheY-like chemotaxis protein